MAEVAAARFAGIEAFALCLDGARMTPDGFDANGDLGVDQVNDPVAVAAVQRALADLGYEIAVDGDYGSGTAEVVRQFKNDQRLDLPPGLSAHDGVTGRGTSGRLDELFTHEVIDHVAATSPFPPGARTGTRQPQGPGLAVCPFENGLVVEVGRFGGFALPSAVAAAWQAAGAGDGPGAPCSPAYEPVPGRTAQDFQHGQIVLDQTGAAGPPVVVPAMVGQAAAGALLLGAPIAGPSDLGEGGTHTPYEHGVVVTSPDGGVYPLPQAVFDEWRRLQADGPPPGPPAGLGFPSGPGETTYPFAEAALVLAADGAVTARPTTPVLGAYFFGAQPEVALRPPAPGTDARVVLGGDRALPEMIADIRTAAAGGDRGFVYLANWFCDAQLEVPMPDGSVARLVDELRAVALAGAQVRALLWDISARTPVPVLGPGLNPIINALAGSPPFNVANIGVNTATAAAIDGLGGDTLAVLDRSYKGVVGSLHQKVLVVSDGRDVTGWVGGIEWNTDRLHHVSKGSPLFDIAARLRGPGGHEVLASFEHRWEATTTAGGPLRSRTLPPAPPTSQGTATVQITHTYSAGFPFRQRVLTAAHALYQALHQARTYFYIEDQYGVGNPWLTVALRRALRRGATGIVVLCPDEANDLVTARFRRREFLNPLKDEFPDRLLVFERLGPLPLRDPTGPRAYVHSKLLIVDDEAAFVGTVNANRRSWFHDTEIMATIVDANGAGGTAPGTRGLARNLRCDLWADHLQLPTATLGDPAADLALWLTHAGGPSTLVRPFSHAHPGPHTPLETLVEPFYLTHLDPA